jgi:hypothetical protein
MTPRAEQDERGRGIAEHRGKERDRTEYCDAWKRHVPESDSHARDRDHTGNQDDAGRPIERPSRMRSLWS